MDKTINNSLIRVAIYIRVSTKLQGEKYSLAAQTTELTKYAEAQNWKIVKIYQDVDSGGKLDKSGLNSLLDDIEEGKVDIVLCVDQDRLSRLDTVDWEYLKSILREHNVKIAEPGNIVDLSNDDQEFFSDLKNLIAKREKKSIVRRMMRGKKERMRNGKAWGKPLFEYVYDRGTATYNAKEEWKWVIPFIDNLYLNEQLGMKSIADRLNEVSKTPTGNQWNEHLVQTRIMSKAFHGVMEKTFRNGEIITKPKIYEELRTEETYNRLQFERVRRGNIYNVTGRRGNNTHILQRTFISCGLCERIICLAHHGTKTEPKYWAKHGRKRKISDGTCCDISINTKRFDSNIMTALKDILVNENLAKRYISIENNEQTRYELNEKIKDIEKELNQLNRSIEKLLDLYIYGNLEQERYKQKEFEINSQIQEKKNSAALMYDKLDAIEKRIWNYTNFAANMKQIKDLEKEMTQLQRAQLFGEIFPKAILFPDQLVLITELFNGIPIEITVPIDPKITKAT